MIPRVCLPLLLLPGLLLSQDQPLKRGLWKPDDVPEGWSVQETRSYQVQSELPPERTKRIVDHLEGMMRTYGQLLPFRKERKKFVLKLFADRKNYLGYGSAGSSLAYYSEGARELVAYDTGKVGGERTRDAEAMEEENRRRLGSEEPPADAPAWRKEAWPILQELRAKLTMDLLGVISHEAWHQYFHHYIVSKVDFPAWLDEGLGDFFSTAGPGLESGDDLRSVPPSEVRVAWIRLGLLEGSTARFREILRFRQDRYYANAQVFYAQGWSMTHFLLTHSDSKVRAIVPTLLRTFKDTHRMDRSTEVAFRGFDPDALEREWRAYVAGLRVADPEIARLLRQAEEILAKHLEGGESKPR